MSSCKMLFLFISPIRIFIDYSFKQVHRILVQIRDKDILACHSRQAHLSPVFSGWTTGMKCTNITLSILINIGPVNTISLNRPESNTTWSRMFITIEKCTELCMNGEIKRNVEKFSFTSRTIGIEICEDRGDSLTTVDQVFRMNKPINMRFELIRRKDYWTSEEKHCKPVDAIRISLLVKVQYARDQYLLEIEQNVVQCIARP